MRRMRSVRSRSFIRPILHHQGVRILRGIMWTFSGAVVALIVFVYLWGVVANILMPMG